MIYKKDCDCKCGAKFTFMYSGKLELEHLEKHGHYHEPSTENLMLSIEKGNPWMMISMKEIPEIVKELQQAYNEYQEIQIELKKQGKLENSVTDTADNQANLSAEKNILLEEEMTQILQNIGHLWIKLIMKLPVILVLNLIREKYSKNP